jgi:uncharacterized iron-regulated protein
MHLLRYFVIVVIIVNLLPFKICEAQQIIRMSDRYGVSLTQMIDDIKSSKVILIGEMHNEKNHHVMQLDVIKALNERGIPLAIGMEMYPSESQGLLDRWNEGKITEQNFQSIYTLYWAEDWLLYRDIFIYARDNHIPLIAINVPKHIMSKVMNQGFASLELADKKNLPPEVTCELNTKYTELLKQSYLLHVNNKKSFTFFCEAQTLFNNGMAWNIAKYLKINPKRTVVTIAGAWHVVKIAIPEQLERYLDISSKVIIPEIPGLSIEIASTKDADYFFK